jgi:RecA-family ATPase
MQEVKYNIEKLGVGNIQIEEVHAHMEAMIKDSGQKSPEMGLFKVQSANSWIEQAKTRPVPRMLFGEFWFEGELCILFADTNLGKSILAVQIGNSISRNQPILGLALEAPKQAVLYFDFELSDKQFETRYSINYEGHYHFDENFIRAEINPNDDVPSEQAFDDYLHAELEKIIVEKGTKIIVIDNLTYLKSETEKAKDALPLMKHLKSLKTKHSLSILALAHTPKRDPSKPITKNDLQGSKMLINFCDSAFTIGESSTDKNLRYIKQIKSRNTEIIYDAENVYICSIDKPSNFLQFEFVSMSSEQFHLKQRSDQDIAEIEEKVLELKAKGKSFREIAKELKISHMKVSRIIKSCKAM